MRIKAIFFNKNREVKRCSIKYQAEAYKDNGLYIIDPENIKMKFESGKIKGHEILFYEDNPVQIGKVDNSKDEASRIINENFIKQISGVKEKSKIKVPLIIILVCISTVMIIFAVFQLGLLKGLI